MAAQDHEETYQKFQELVNMAPAEIEDWLQTEESRAVGQDSGDGESIGHKSGHRIVQIKRTKKADLSPDDYAHMQKVISYISRHSAQKPSQDVEGSNWRYSLKNWGHDPLK
jgi:excinuclease UvrABC nuclease subunit